MADTGAWATGCHNYVCAGSDRAGLNLLEKVAKLRKRDLTDGDDG